MRHQLLSLFTCVALTFNLGLPAFQTATSAQTPDANESVSIQSLLQEMTDHDNVARFPEFNFRLKQASSYNRASKTPDDPKGWFNNMDRKGQAVRVDEKDGEKEWVLMDHKGPGAIVRIWMPWHNQLKSGSESTLRFYLDGQEQPTIEGNLLGMFDGTGFVPPPFAHSSLRSAVSFFPIPYQKSCKITTDKEPFFYQFTYRAYDEGASIKTFTMDDFEAAKELTQTAGKELLNPTATETTNALDATGKLKTKESVSLDLPSKTAAVRELTVKLDDYSNPDVTRLVVLKMEFDGKETVWCPIGDFFRFRDWFESCPRLVSHGCRRRHDDLSLGDAVSEERQSIGG